MEPPVLSTARDSSLTVDGMVSGESYWVWVEEAPGKLTTVFYDQFDGLVLVGPKGNAYLFAKFAGQEILDVRRILYIGLRRPTEE
jgi:hypothetical protein